jgi:hypothetical protein|tara:strand:- start:1307 stop:1693 length:387 start_codon:yes stop_codon:yes gene_type:complete
VEKDNLITETTEKYPFLTGIQYGQDEYIGVVVNHDNTILTFYDISKIASQKERQEFLELGETWWWESNRQLPIDIFLHYEMKQYHNCLRTFVMKDIDILFGPVTSLQNLLKKRIKRRGVQLVIKPKEE